MSAAPGPHPDSFEANNTVGTAKTVTTIDDCGDTTGSLTGTINPGTDVDWYKFTLTNSSSLCDYGTTVKMTPPANRNYDLLVCVSQSSSFSGDCALGSRSGPLRARRIHLLLVEQRRRRGRDHQDQLGVRRHLLLGCHRHRVRAGDPQGGSETAECAVGYSLTWGDD